MTGFVSELFPYHAPEGGWATTVRDLRARAGLYVETHIIFYMWVRVSCWLSQGKAEGALTGDVAEISRAVRLRGVLDQRHYNHPACREPWFEGHEAHKLEGDDLERVNALADMAREQWLAAGGTLKDHMIRSCHQAALYERNLVQAGLVA